MIFVPYHESVSLAQGVDALQDYQRLKLQKALSMIQLGSQFGDKGALAQGFSMLGLKDTAMKYTEPDIMETIKSDVAKEEGKKIATEAALAEFGKSYAQDAEKARENLAKKLATKQDKAGNAVLDEKLYAKYMNNERQLLEKANKEDEDYKQLAKYAQNKDILKQEYGGYTVPTKEEEDYRISNAIKNLSSKVLTKQENIDKYILGAKDQPEAINRLRDMVTAVIQKKGALSIDDAIKFQETERALARLYGQEYKPIFNYAALTGQRQGGGGGKDYVIMKNGKVLHQGTFANADAARQFAEKKGYKNAIVIQGTAEKAQNLLSRAMETIRNETALKSAGIKYGGGFLGLGEKTFRDIQTGKEITRDELLQRIMLIQQQEDEDSDADYIDFVNKKIKSK